MERVCLFSAVPRPTFNSSCSQPPLLVYLRFQPDDISDQWSFAQQNQEFVLSVLSLPFLLYRLLDIAFKFVSLKHR